MIDRLKIWLVCLFFDHLWDERSHPDDEVYQSRAYWEDWQVCLRCGKDSRPIEAIQDDNDVRMERLVMRLKDRKHE